MPASDEDSFEAPRPGLDAKGRGSPQVPQKRAESGLGESQRLQLVGDTRAPFGFSEGKERQISHSRVGRIIPSTIQRLAQRGKAASKLRVVRSPMVSGVSPRSWARQRTTSATRAGSLRLPR